MNTVDLKSISIMSIAEAAGIVLSPAGTGRFVGLCPLHTERSPSFFVFEGKNRYKCFGCQSGGDSVDLYMALHHCSFREAVHSLTGGPVRWTPPDREEARRRALVKKFREWENWYSEILCQWTGAVNRLLFRACKGPDDLDRYAEIIRLKGVAENHLHVLAYGDTRQKHEMFQAIRRGHGDQYV